MEISMKATDDFKKEHQGIELMLRILQGVSERIRSGEQIQAEHLNGIMEFFSIVVDKCHHGKEEEFLFPALEAAGVPRDSGPIGVMLSEHEQGRKLVPRLKEAVRSYISREKTATSAIRKIVDEYTALLTQHIEKENSVLFVMAVQN